MCTEIQCQSGTMGCVLVFLGHTVPWNVLVLGVLNLLCIAMHSFLLCTLWHDLDTLG